MHGYDWYLAPAAGKNFKWENENSKTVQFDLSRSQVDRLSGPLSVHY